MSEDLRVLVIDTPGLGLIRRADRLLRDGHDVHLAESDHAARDKLAAARPHVVLLGELDTPSRGLSLLRDLRAGAIQARSANAQVVMFGGDDDQSAQLRYEAGADIVLPSTASPGLVAAAVKMLDSRARPSTPQPDRMLQIGELTVDPDSRTVRRGDQVVMLSPREFQLLSCLAEEPTRTYTRAEIAQSVWGNEIMATNSRTLDSHAHRLRSKLAEVGLEDRVANQWGVGYRLER